jgi:hypothetical protein
MKIEIGESLMLSWLRHVKGCQMVQLNWKPSVNSWELYNEQKLETIMIESKQYFEDRYGINIFKQTKSYSQLIQQGEVDALGIEINHSQIQHLYAIDIAFHENGLNYGSKEETLARVLKKMIRTAMIIIGYFNLDKAELIFASPKVHLAIYEPLAVYINNLNHFFTKYGVDFHFAVICNDQFKGDIFDEVTRHSKFISDTSELFMRSIQLYNLLDLRS